MKEEIETMLKSGGLKLAAMRGIQAKKAALLDAMRAEQARSDGEKLLSLVPAELHEYVSHDHRYVNISLPGAAHLAAEYRVTTESREFQGMSDLFIAEIWLKEHAASGNVWSLWRYQAYEGDTGLVPCGETEFYKDLDVALARAVELGDGKAEAEAEAAKQRAEFAEWDAPDDSVDEPPYRYEICPLMSTVDKNKTCKQHECAWFLRGVCAVKLIAANGESR
jgi:hypothetical protein